MPMRGVLFREFGPPTVLELAEHLDVPSRRKGEVLVEVYATSVNPVDVKTRRGEIPSFMVARPKVLGGDVAGVVVEADLGSALKPGTRVAFLCDGFRPNVRWGSYAEFVAVPESQVAPLPEGLQFTQAAGLPLATLTALQALEQLQLQPGQRLLVHAGAGGVGSMAVQLAKARGLHVTATCSTRNVQFVEELGADEVIDYTQQQFEEVCRDKPFDAIFDLVGGDYETRSLGLLKPGGTFVNFLAKSTIWPLVKGKLRSWLGLGPRYQVITVRPDGKGMAQVLQLVTEGKLKPIVDQVLSLGQASAAHEYVEKGHARGKVILRVKEHPDSSGTLPVGSS